MTISRTVTVFGSTGGTGRELVARALDAGHHVRAVARRPDQFDIIDPRLTVRQADVLSGPDALVGAISGADAVVSALGSHSGRHPTEVYSTGVQNIHRAMGRVGVRRLIVISALPVCPDVEKNLIDRLLVHRLLHMFFGGSYDDLGRMEAYLAGAADLDWTVFRPPYLQDGPASGRVRTAVGAGLRGARSIRRADLASAMLDAVGDSSLIGKSVNIAE